MPKTKDFDTLCNKLKEHKKLSDEASSPEKMTIVFNRITKREDFIEIFAHGKRFLDY